MIAIAYGVKTRLRDAIDAANAALPKTLHGELYDLLLKGATFDETELICKFDGFESSWEFNFRPRKQNDSNLRSFQVSSDSGIDVFADTQPTIYIGDRLYEEPY